MTARDVIERHLNQKAGLVLTSEANADAIIAALDAAGYAVVPKNQTAALRADNSAPLPAAPAPVCEWTKHAEKRWSIQCTPHGFFNPHPKRLAANKCAMCKRPIKFMEAQR